MAFPTHGKNTSSKDAETLRKATPVLYPLRAWRLGVRLFDTPAALDYKASPRRRRDRREKQFLFCPLMRRCGGIMLDSGFRPAARDSSGMTDGSRHPGQVPHPVSQNTKISMRKKCARRITACMKVGREPGSRLIRRPGFRDLDLDVIQGRFALSLPST
jgi:hypothetical protein